MRKFDLTADATRSGASAGTDKRIDLTKAAPKSMPARLRFPQVSDWAKRAMPAQDRGDQDRREPSAIRTWMLDAFDELDPVTHLEAEMAWNLILAQTLARTWLTEAAKAGDAASAAAHATEAATIMHAAASMVDSLRALQDDAALAIADGALGWDDV